MSNGENKSTNASDEKSRPAAKPQHKFIPVLKNNKTAIFLGITLLIVLVWFYIELQVKETAFKHEKIEIVTAYESKIDSLKVDHIKFATEVFSWSVRSELLRENTENLNQLLTIFVQQSGADIVQLVNPKDNTVILSSDKKFEGTTISDYGDLASTIVINKENTVEIISPVMGFNEKIGVLIVELKFNTSTLSKTQYEKLPE